MENVIKFYHVTVPIFKQLITKAQKLIPQTHNPSQDWMRILDSKHKNEIPKGVWFCSTLFNGSLPNKSPYGNERISIDIEKVFSQLGGNVNIYRGKDAKKNNNTYVRLMIVKDGHHFDCLQHMEKLNSKDNDWLKCISGSKFEVAKRPIWVEIFCPYEVDITEGEWDTVNK